MLARFKKLMPSKDSVANNKWLRWLGPWIHHPRLWHMSRKGIAMGLALGVFFGFLIPIAQIPASVTVAVILRANVPVAIASTLVTNPVTFGPVYYGAYHLGKYVLFENDPSDAELQALLQQQTLPSPVELSFTETLAASWNQLGQVGKPLIVGLAIVATAAGMMAYLLVHLGWVLRVKLQRAKRVRKRAKPSNP